MFEALWLLPQEGLYACFAEGKVWHVAPLSGAGKVYRAKVERLSPALGGAFVDLGEAKALLRTDLAYSVGDTLAVQEVEAAQPPKLAVVSDQVSVAGQYSVFLPNVSDVRYSRRLSPAMRAEAERWPWPKGGRIVRSGLTARDKEEALAEAERMNADWRKLPQGLGLLYQPPVDYRALCQLAKSAQSNDEALCRQTGAAYVPDLALRWQRVWQAEQTGQVVATPEGVELTFDHTEAAWVVDVDSAKYMPCLGAVEAAMAVNRAAAKELVRQLGLRNLSGAIVVDFVTVPKAQGKALLGYLADLAVAYDPKLHILDYTALGMVEMTRAR